MPIKDRHSFAESCFRGDSPPCIPACPFGLDIVSMNKKLQKGRFDGAYAAYRDAVLFPAIVCRLCHGPCAQVCVRKDSDQSVDMPFLERAVVDLAKRTAPRRLGLPSKGKSAAIVGAGICGLACALTLATHGYGVTVYERSERIGGSLWEQLPEELFMGEINNQMQFAEYELITGAEIQDVQELRGRFDAVLIAAGRQGADFSLREGLNAESLGTTQEGIFMAGGAAGAINSAMSVENGIRAAQSMESYMQIGRMHEMAFVRTAKPTRFRMDPADIEPMPRAAADEYTAEAVVQEAKRCLLCNCEQCRRGCDMMQWYRQAPKSLIADVNDALRLTGDMKVHGPQPLGRVTKRQVSSCLDCGYCGTACPEAIDTGAFMMDARRQMREKGTLPEVFHDFWLRDMEHAIGEESFLARNAPGLSADDHVFFPGCQLGSSDPAYVTGTYSYLLKRFPATGLILSCCGIPAEWAGDMELLRSVTERNRRHWDEMGRPTIIFACPTCEKALSKHLPEAKLVSVYNIMAADPALSAATCASTAAIFDPCASRGNSSMQSAVRTLAEKAGIEVRELPFHGQRAQCCGHGGNIYSANPDLANAATKKRTEANDLPYITYCTNCRDLFADKGKECRHILDQVLGINSERRSAPSLSLRRENRVRTKTSLLSDIWNEPVSAAKGSSRLIIPDELTEKMNRRLLLASEVEAVVEHCEATGMRLYSEKHDCYIGHLRQGFVTCWVMYRPEGSSLRLVDVYSHRMAIEGE